MSQLWGLSDWWFVRLLWWLMIWDYLRANSQKFTIYYLRWEKTGQNLWKLWCEQGTRVWPTYKPMLALSPTVVGYPLLLVISCTNAGYNSHVSWLSCLSFFCWSCATVVDMMHPLIVDRSNETLHKRLSTSWFTPKSPTASDVIVAREISNKSKKK